jgi:hypothetical protein
MMMRHGPWLEIRGRSASKGIHRLTIEISSSYDLSSRKIPGQFVVQRLPPLDDSKLQVEARSAGWIKQESAESGISNSFLPRDATLWIRPVWNTIRAKERERAMSRGGHTKVVGHSLATDRGTPNCRQVNSESAAATACAPTFVPARTTSPGERPWYRSAAPARRAEPSTVRIEASRAARSPSAPA